MTYKLTVWRDYQIKKKTQQIQFNNASLSLHILFINIDEA